jgi:hypothetical protein
MKFLNYLLQLIKSKFLFLGCVPKVPPRAWDAHEIIAKTNHFNFMFACMDFVIIHIAFDTLSNQA